MLEQIIDLYVQNEPANLQQIAESVVYEANRILRDSVSDYYTYKVMKYLAIPVIAGFGLLTVASYALISHSVNSDKQRKIPKTAQKTTVTYQSAIRQSKDFVLDNIQVLDPFYAWRDNSDMDHYAMKVQLQQNGKKFFGYIDEDDKSTAQSVALSNQDQGYKINYKMQNNKLRILDIYPA